MAEGGAISGFLAKLASRRFPKLPDLRIWLSLAMPRIKFRMRTLLTVVAVVALTAGGARWWYNVRIAEYRIQRRLADELVGDGMFAVWTYVGPTTFEAWRWVEGPLFRRPTHAYSDHAADEALADHAATLRELQVETLTTLARQIVPHVRAAAEGKDDPLVAALRGHPTLVNLVIDASIRGTPEGFEQPLYTREDLAAVEAALPKLRVQWIEAN